MKIMSYSIQVVMVAPHKKKCHINFGSNFAMFDRNVTFKIQAESFKVLTPTFSNTKGKFFRYS